MAWCVGEERLAFPGGALPESLLAAGGASPVGTALAVAGAARPGLFATARVRLRARRVSLRTEKAYLYWIRAFVRFHGGRHPRGLGAVEMERFLTYLAVQRSVSASTQNQALAALLFLFRHVLGVEPPWVANVTRAERRRRVPVVLSRDEVRRVLVGLRGIHALLGALLYGTGMRVMECLALRVKDLDFDRGEIVVRGGLLGLAVCVSGAGDLSASAHGSTGSSPSA